MMVSFVRKFGRIGAVLVVVSAALQLGACGADEEKAQEAAKWLKSYGMTNPPNDWVVTEVKVDDDGKIVMNVMVPFADQVDLIKQRTKIEKAHIAQGACPPKGVQVWTMLSSAQMVWINLLERRDDGSVKTLIGASCKH